MAKFVAKNISNDSINKVDVGIAKISVVGLPSNNLGYPEDLEIKYTPYLVGEIDELAIVKNPIDSYDVIGRGIYVSSKSHPEFTVDDLYFIDFTYIGMMRLLTSFSSPKYAVQGIVCDNIIDSSDPEHIKVCGEEGQLIFEIKDVQFEDVQVKQLPIVLKSPSHPEGIELIPPTLRVVKETSKIIKDNKKLTPSQILATLVKVPKYSDALELIKSLTLGESDLMNKIDAKLRLGLVPIDYKCPKCGKIHKIRLDGGKVIRPFRELSTTEGYEILGL